MTAESVSITEFGALPDGETLCTEAFHAAVQACSAAGGGVIHVPAGTFRTGPIRLASNITLHIAAGARVVFSADPADFPVVFSRWEGVEREVFSPLIYGKDLQNVTLTGHGVLDGQGEPWWVSFRQKNLPYPRPCFIGFDDCTNVLIEGVTLVNSPAWTIHPVACENVTVHHISIRNPALSPNTDGINPDSCQNVRITNCQIDVGDDCITLKSGTEECGRRIPCENITITNCTMIHGHGGVVIGSEMSGGVRNVAISNCVFEGTDRGIRLKSRRGRGGVVEDVRVDNIIMKDVLCPIVMHLYYHCGPGGKEPQVADQNSHPVTERTPAFRRIHLSNITAREVRTAAAFLFGLPELPISEITLDNVVIQMAEAAAPEYPDMMTHLEPMAKKGLLCANLQGLALHHVFVSNQDGPAFRITRSADVELARCMTANSDPEQPVVQLEDVNRALLHGNWLADDSGIFLELKGSANQRIELFGNSRTIGSEQIRFSDGASESALL
ncbi:polygalacturonase [Hydrogenispora ethanolica]|uniref:Polygalacturonase n=1 Tax=Hydrogenispora ethanolica TaxID=1082276 RepID=A0A4R1RH15_HYDET|nr:glycoside hydrolase family 28 protein [Hydrogenispora ethanolica]TCL65333.1 polygalacturonase [Hydrogenispora ethanolica]